MVSQARRRAATQMELLYASSGDLSCESPTGDFPSPLPPLSERQEGLSDTQGHACGPLPEREQTVSPSSLTYRPATLSVNDISKPSLSVFWCVVIYHFATVCRSGARSPTGSERRQMERSPLGRRKQTPPTTTAAAHTPSVSTAEAVAKSSTYQSL